MYNSGSPSVIAAEQRAVGVQGQVVLGDRDRLGDPRAADAGQVEPGCRLRVHGQHDLVDRGVGDVALRDDGVHDVLEPDGLVGQPVDGDLAHVVDQLGHGVVGPRPGAQGEGVDEAADQRLPLAAGSTRHGSADDDVVGAGPAAQHHVQPGQQHHERCRPRGSRHAPHGLPCGVADAHRDRLTSGARDERPGAVGGQRQRGGGVVEVVDPVLEGGSLGALRCRPVVGEVGVLQARRARDRCRRTPRPGRRAGSARTTRRRRCGARQPRAGARRGPARPATPARVARRRGRTVARRGDAGRRCRSPPSTTDQLSCGAGSTTGRGSSSTTSYLVRSTSCRWTTVCHAVRSRPASSSPCSRNTTGMT